MHDQRECMKTKKERAEAYKIIHFIMASYLVVK